MANVRPGVEVAVVQDQAGIAALLPYCRHRRAGAAPIAGTFSDLEGGVYRNEYHLDPFRLLRHLRLGQWHYRNWLADQEPFGAWAASRFLSPVIDLTEGWNAYCQYIRSRGSEILKRTEQKRRKVNRELGTIRYELDWPDVATLHQALAWKQQWAESKGIYNAIDEPWHRPMLERLIDYHDGVFRGQMACLLINNRPAAVTLMIRNKRVVALWFGAFDRRYASYSVGAICDYELLRAAADHGIQSIELGRGDERYKRQLANRSIPVVEGELRSNRMSALCSQQWLRIKQYLRSSPWAEPLRKAVWTVRQRRTNACRVSVSSGVEHNAETDQHQTLAEVRNRTTTWHCCDQPLVRAVTGCSTGDQNGLAEAHGCSPANSAPRKSLDNSI